MNLTDSYECPQCKGRRETYDCSWCDNTGRIPLNNIPKNPDFKPNAPHAYSPFTGTICECLRFQEHPVHGGAMGALLELPLFAA